MVPSILSQVTAIMYLFLPFFLASAMDIIVNRYQTNRYLSKNPARISALARIKAYEFLI